MGKTAAKGGATLASLDAARVGRLLVPTQDVRSVSERRVQSLWAGFGAVSCLTATLAAGGQQTLMVKRVDPPAVDAASVGDQRKLRSYAVECAFYHRLAAGLRDAGVTLAHPYLLERAGYQFTLVMTDLSHEFPVSPGSMSVAQAKVAVAWLAGFHAHFWEQPREELGVWEQGGYWYLDTRREEFESMGREWSRLKAAAAAIDWRVKGGGSSKFRTLVHGDFKAANILFSGDGKSCAAYDFQYVGEGYGVRDVVMLLHSSLQRSAVGAELEILKHYHTALTSKLGSRAAGYTEEVMAAHYALCVADYVRFMAGWGFWGTDATWSKQQAEAVLERLDGGSETTAAQYRLAVEREFPLD